MLGSGKPMVPVNWVLVTILLVPAAHVSLMPHPSIIGQPVAWCHCLAVPSEAAIPPACDRHSCEKSMDLNCGCCIKELNKVFTAGKRWKGRFFSTSMNFP